MTASDAGERLDRVLAKRVEGFSRSTLSRWIDAGRVTVEGQPLSRDAKVVAGWVVRVEPMLAEPTEAIPQAMPMTVYYEDAHLIVVEKPAGLVVHPAPGHPDGTLVNGILHRCPELRTEDGDPMRPGIVHRLDKDTSGVMVVAKSLQAKTGLSAMFAAHDLERVYTAVIVADARLFALTMYPASALLTESSISSTVPSAKTVNW